MIRAGFTLSSNSRLTDEFQQQAGLPGTVEEAVAACIWGEEEEGWKHSDADGWGAGNGCHIDMDWLRGCVGEWPNLLMRDVLSFF